MTTTIPLSRGKHWTWEEFSFGNYRGRAWRPNLIPPIADWLEQHKGQGCRLVREKEPWMTKDGRERTRSKMFMEFDDPNLAMRFKLSLP